VHNLISSLLIDTTLRSAACGLKKSCKMKQLREQVKVKTLDAEHKMRDNLLSVLLTNAVGLAAAGKPERAGAQSEASGKQR
jgi:hypothetical protein